MNCKNVQASLSAYLDRELPSEEMQAVREHLFDCERCQEEESSLNALKQLLRGAPAVEPAAEFEDRLIANVFGAKDDGHVPAKVSYLLVSGVAAAAMLATLFVLSALSRPGAPSIPNGQSREMEYAISRDRAFDAGSDPLSGTPAVMPMTYDRH